MFPGKPAVSNAADLLPHTGAALLLASVVRHGPTFIEAIASIPLEYPLVNSGTAPCFVGIEVGAQAAGALEVLRRRNSGGQVGRIGRLVRVREAMFRRTDLPAATPLLVTAALEGEAAPLAIYRVEISVAGVSYFSAVVSTHCM